MRRSLSLLLAVVSGGLLMVTSGLFATDTATAGAAFVLLVLCLWPSVAWAHGGMGHLPLFEVYCLMHLIYYWLPAGKQGGELLALNMEERLTVLGAVSIFLAGGQVVYFTVLRSLRRRPAAGWSFWNNQVSAMQGARLPWVLLGIWLLFNTSSQFGFIWNWVPGGAMPLVRALCGAAGMLGIFVLGHKLGEGKLSRFQAVCYVGAILAGTLISFASGYLAVGTIFVGNAFFAYMVGGRHLPVLSLSLFIVLVSFLNYGKGEMRIRYWAMGESTDDLIELYSHWFKSSWEQFNLPADRRQGAISAFERANLTEICAHVITQTPHPLPFLGGKTYLDSLQLLVPRAIWPDRPSLHIIMTELGLRYGIHMNIESTESTMISIGQIGEAWANGGWLVVGLVGAFFGLLFSVGMRVAYQRSFTTVGFLFGMTFVGFAANLEHLAGTLMMTFNQTAFASLLLLYWFSRRSIRSAPMVTRIGSNAGTVAAPRPLATSRAGE